jgi:dihydroxyacetone kinase
METLTLNDIIKAIDVMSEIIIKNEIYFCELDSAAGDGDLGTSLAKGFKILHRDLATFSKEDIGALLKACSMVITEHCGGASGPIWGSAFRSASKYAIGKKELTLKELSELLQSAVDGIQKTGGAKLGDKTLLDALIPATESLKKSSNDQEKLMYALNKSAKEAIAGAEKTKEFIALKGRASYVGARSINHPDAGAMVVGVVFMGLFHARLQKIEIP